jgi:hypothetical protein
MKKSDVVTTIIAVYGAILSTIAILNQVIGDRAKVKLTVSKDMEIIGDPRYMGMTVISLEATNTGRRPVTIKTLGAQCLYPHKHFIATDTRPQLPCEISEGKYISGIIDQADTDFSRIDFWAAWDSHGRVYKLRVASRIAHWKSVLRRRWSPLAMKKPESTSTE